MSIWDILLTILYLPLCLFIGSRIKRSHRKNPLYKKWFMKGLTVKLFGGLAFALVYTFYYTYGGDTSAYFHDAHLVMQSLGKGPVVFWEVLHHEFTNVSADSMDYILHMNFKDPREYFVVNVISVFVLLGAGSYFSATLLVALFTYWGVWHFFLLLVRKYPAMEKQMAFVVLFIPSVFFWGSGIGKDSLILCAVGLMLYHVDQIMSGKFWKLNSLIIIAVSAYFMYVVKAYVLMSLVPALVLWRTLHFRDKLPRGLIRSAALPVVGAISILAIVYTLDFLSQYSPRYNVDSFVTTAQSMQGWHYVEGANTSEEHGRGSSYTLGEYDETSWKGVLKVFPAAVNVTYFRPYLWEATNAVMLAQALESFAFLLFTLFILIKVGPFRTYRLIADDAFLLMCVVFAIFFGFAVGFSSYNFGALSRYRVPVIPFFAASLFIIRQKSILMKKSKTQTSNVRRNKVYRYQSQRS